MTVPDVDLVIAVHDLSRPVGRAAASALDGDHVRVTIVCHELAAADVEANLPDDVRGRVRLLEVRDGLGSPSGPFNAGLDAASARYVAIMGSDDYLEPGALRAWTRAADTASADVVLAPMRHQSGEPIHTPRVRPLRSRRLDLVRDRLAYRTAPLGVLRRDTVEGDGLRFPQHLRSGEDVPFSLRLWSSHLRIDLARHAPRYVVGSDARSRVTTAIRPLPDELAAWEYLLDQAWFLDLPPDRRRAVAVKALRIHLLGAVRRRPSDAQWGSGEASWVRALATRLTNTAPGVLRPHSRADRELLDVVIDPASTESDVAQASARRAGAGCLDFTLTPRVVDNVDRESVLRHYVGMRLPR